LKTSARRREAAGAAALFAALTLALTWPLARGLTRDLPSDFGDPLLNTWILAWDATHLGRGWWDANIYYPHPLALAYSEHLFAQALQILPVYAVTGNPVLCYNLLFLSTFVLSGLGMFLLVRELTSEATSALVGGLAFAFAPYRVASLPHLQVLSSAWMPFVLFGFRRHFATRHPLPLACAAIAWLLQNLSCGYYLLFFSPVVIGYLIWEVTTRRLWGDARLIVPLAAALGVVALATVPFLLPYLQLRRLGFDPRSLDETRRFSADVYGYFTADPNLRGWGSIARTWPKAEGSLFPGVTIAVLAAIAAGRELVGARQLDNLPRGLVNPPRGLDKWSRWALLPLIALAVSAGVVVALLMGYTVRLPGLKITSFSRALLVTCVIGGALLATSAGTRRAAGRWLSSLPGFFTLVTLFGIVMSFGPEIQAKGRVVAGAGLYAGFYRFVPGFDGLRVPSRFGMIVALGLAVLASLALATMASRASRRLQAQLAVIVATLVILESFAAPIPINQNSTEYKQHGLAPLPDSLEAGITGTTAVYTYIAALPDSGAILELPLGEPAFDVRYMFYSTRHWRRLVNGYTGGQPADYRLLDQTLQDLMTGPERAWRVLASSGATHVVVHESSYALDRGPRVSEWLRAHGARELRRFGSDRVFRIRVQGGN
jgi:hypothetical protein